MLINLTNILTENFIKNFKTTDMLNFYNINKQTDFICVARIYSVIPSVMRKRFSGKSEIGYEAVPLTEDKYILFLQKVDNCEVVDLKSGIKLGINLNPTSTLYEAKNGIHFCCYEDSPLCIKMELVLANSNAVRKKLKRLYKGNTEVIPTLTELQSKAKSKFRNKRNELFEHIFCGTDLEKEFFIKNFDETKLYDDCPQVGDYFGYVGPINHIVPKSDKVSEDSKSISFESYSLDENPKYPFIFKRISEDTVMEIVTKTKFYFSPVLSKKFSSAKCATTTLHITGTDYIVVNDFFKAKYSELIKDYEAYKTWVLNQEKKAITLYQAKQLELDNVKSDKVEEVYEIAYVDNMMFDLDRTLKKTNESDIK